MRHQCPACESWHDAEEKPIDWKAEHEKLKRQFEDLHRWLSVPPPQYQD